MGRPRNQQARRADIVDAAFEVIRERGIVNMRIQDIAERAGVSAGTVHYHFSDTDELIYDIHSRACERFYSKRLQSVTEHADAREQLVQMIAGGLPDSQDDPVVIAMYEIDLYRREQRASAHALLSQALFDRQATLYFAVLQLGQAQGHFTLAAPALNIAQNLVALEDAYGLHVITHNDSAKIERSRELILEYARLATDCGELGETLGA